MCSQTDLTTGGELSIIFVGCKSVLHKSTFSNVRSSRMCSKTDKTCCIPQQPTTLKTGRIMIH
jgi:hypothetical protein